MAQEITENDKLMAAISYPIPLLAIIILLVESMRTRAFQKYHAVQALAADIALWAIVIILSCLLGPVLGGIGGTLTKGDLGFLGCLGFLPWLLPLITLYWAYRAYQGQYFDIPVITNFIKNQKWV